MSTGTGLVEGAQDRPSASRAAVVSRDPLSRDCSRLNGHTNYLDPVFGLSFPTAAVADPVTVLWESHSSRQLALAAIRRADSVCRYCGLRSRKYQSAVGPRSAASSSQAHCACPMCAQVTALDLAFNQRSGILVHLPEMGQAELNAYLRITYVCRISQGEAADLARNYLDHLMGRRNGAKELIGTDNPGMLSRRLAQAGSPQALGGLLAGLKDIRLLPLDRRIIREGDLEFNQFPQMLAYWRAKEGPFGGLPAGQMDLTAFRERLAGIFG